MDIRELLFTVLSFIALFFAILSTMPKRTKNGLPEPFEEEPDEWEEEEEQEEKKIPPKKKREPPPVPALRQVKEKTPLRASRGADEKFVFHSSMETFQQKTTVEDRQLGTRIKPGDLLVSEDLRTAEGVVYKKKKEAPIARLLRAMPKKNTILVAREVLDVPVAFRKSPFPRDV
jgi:hypothetical protein